MFLVKQAFKTPLRSFIEGQSISAEDIDGLLSVDQWVSLGFLQIISASTSTDQAASSETTSDTAADKSSD
jgi:hypothetical protein